MNAAEYLSRVGFDWLVEHRLGGPTQPDTHDDMTRAEEAEAVAAARLIDHARVREALLSEPPSPIHADRNGAKWLARLTWPDRVPGLKTWGGQSTLAKIIAAHQRRLKADDTPDLFAVRGVYRTAKSEGPSGIDPRPAQDSRDVGFSLAQLGMDIGCWPAVELLAVLGLESVPLVSFGPRECGFIHAGRVWRFDVEERAGGYAFRWGEVREYRTDPGETELEAWRTTSVTPA